MWIKPDCGYQPTPPRCHPGFGHRIGKLRFEANVERAARDMLAVLGDAKGRPGEQGSSRRAGPK
jgi:hypothetical protein